MKCDWCENERHTYQISFYGGCLLNICGDCYMDMQPVLFCEETEEEYDYSVVVNEVQSIILGKKLLQGDE